VAVSYLLKRHPPGLVDGLADLLWSADPELNLQIRWALRQLGTDKALTVLRRFKTGNLGSEVRIADDRV
jgi:hypothetical protein